MIRALLWSITASTPHFKGKFRLFSALSRPGRPPGLVVTRGGARFRLWGHDLNEWYIATQRNHSSNVSDCLDRLAASRVPCVLWDIGANIGGVALPFLRRHAEARAICFEPSPEVAGRLLANLALNPDLAARCEVVVTPLADRDGATRFFVSSETFNSGVGGLGLSHNRGTCGVRTVCQTGDTAALASELPPPTLIKLDVEGFELEVLNGLVQTLKCHRPAIVFEHSLYRHRERGYAANDVVVSRLRQLEYEIWSLDGSRRVTDDELGSDCDLLALPRSG